MSARDNVGPVADALATLVTTRAFARAWLAVDGVTQILARIQRAPVSNAASRMDLARVCAAVKRTERVVNRVPFIGKQCLHRALGRYAALRRAGFDAVFVLGVRKDARDLEGHAWVEVDGAPILEREPPQFVVTYSTKP